MKRLRVEPVIAHHRAPWQALHATADALEIVPDGLAGALRLPWSEVDLAGIEAPRTVPDNAMVLLTRESPGGYWYLLPVYVLLAAFAALFVWAFVRRLRDVPPGPMPSPVLADPSA